MLILKQNGAVWISCFVCRLDIVKLVGFRIIPSFFDEIFVVVHHCGYVLLGYSLITKT